MDLSLGSCAVDGCGAAVEGEDDEVRRWLVWHVYDDHPDWWWAALEADGETVNRLPIDRRPDLALVYPWPPIIPSLCLPPICNREKGHPPPHYGGSSHASMIRVVNP